MPQTLLPVYPAEATPVNGLISFCKRDGSVAYFHGCLPVFSHAESDVKSFRLFTSQLVVNGSCTQAELVRAFGISGISVKRHVERLRFKGGRGLYKVDPIVPLRDATGTVVPLLIEGVEPGA